MLITCFTIFAGWRSVGGGWDCRIRRRRTVREEGWTIVRAGRPRSLSHDGSAILGVEFNGGAQSLRVPSPSLSKNRALQLCPWKAEAAVIGCCVSVLRSLMLTSVDRRDRCQRIAGCLLLPSRSRVAEVVLGGRGCVGDKCTDCRYRGCCWFVPLRVGVFRQHVGSPTLSDRDCL